MKRQPPAKEPRLDIEAGTAIVQPEVLSEDAWRELGTSLFGPDTTRWRFKCPNCCGVMSIAEARKLPAELLELLRAGNWSVEQECVGRHLSSLGCNWCAYGLFQGPYFVERSGHRTPVFGFAIGAQP